MPKLPLNVMEIPCNKFLSRWLLGEILNEIEKQKLSQHSSLQTWKRNNNKKDQSLEGETTSGGKTFSAARRGTEKPPCVLVSLAVNVLQK